jgi:hypothetical protein
MQPQRPHIDATLRLNWSWAYDEQQIKTAKIVPVVE